MISSKKCKACQHALTLYIDHKPMKDEPTKIYFCENRVCPEDWYKTAEVEDG